MTSKVNIQNVLPSVYSIDPIVSGSKSVLRSDFIEFLPTDTGDFSYDGNNIIRFKMSSQSDIMHPQDSFLRYDLSIAGQTLECLSHLDLGGSQAWMRMISLLNVSSGLVIERNTYNNRWCAIKSLLHVDRSETQNIGWSGGDGVAFHSENYPLRDEWLMHHPNPNVAYDDSMTGGVVSGTQATVFVARYAYVGMPIIMQQVDHADGSMRSQWKAIIVAVDPDLNTFTVFPSTDFEGSALDGAVTYRTEYDLDFDYTQALCRTTQSSRLCTGMPFSLFTHNIPLILFPGGLEMQIELEAPHIAFYNEAGAEITYTISNPRFYTRMSTPHQRILQTYIQHWKSPEGLTFALSRYAVRRVLNSGGSTENTIQLNFGTRSSRTLYLVFQDTDISETNSPGSRRNPSLSTFIRSNISRIQVQIGSHQYPMREIYCDGDSTELFRHLTEACRNYGSVNRIQPRLWRSYNTLYLADSTYRKFSSKHFIVTIPLDRLRDGTGQMSGIDLSVVPMDIKFSRSFAHNSASSNLTITGGEEDVGSAFLGDCVLYAFVEHDAYLRISSENPMSVLA